MNTIHFLPRYIFTLGIKHASWCVLTTIIIIYDISLNTTGAFCHEINNYDFKKPSYFNPSIVSLI